ncbi:MAG: hypothetical protein WAM28_06335 [Chlamydiales bacterium]
MTNLIKQDFNLVSSWREEGNYLIDESTNRKYLNESKGLVRKKCLLLALGTPIVHLIASIINILIRLIKIIAFWMNGCKNYGWKERLKEKGAEVAKLGLALITPIALEMASLYGCYSPYDGRKLYASIERASYGGPLLAPCFQPSATRHLFGGDINEKDVW